MTPSAVHLRAFSATLHVLEDVREAGMDVGSSTTRHLGVAFRLARRDDPSRDSGELWSALCDEVVRLARGVERAGEEDDFPELEQAAADVVAAARALRDRAPAEARPGSRGRWFLLAAALLLVALGLWQAGRRPSTTVPSAATEVARAPDPPAPSPIEEHPVITVYRTTLRPALGARGKSRLDAIDTSHTAGGDGRRIALVGLRYTVRHFLLVSLEAAEPGSTGRDALDDRLSAALFILERTPIGCGEGSTWYGSVRSVHEALRATAPGDGRWPARAAALGVAGEAEKASRSMSFGCVSDLRTDAPALREVAFHSAQAAVGAAFATDAVCLEPGDAAAPSGADLICRWGLDPHRSPVLEKAFETLAEMTRVARERAPDAGGDR